MCSFLFSPLFFDRPDQYRTTTGKPERILLNKIAAALDGMLTHP